MCIKGMLTVTHIANLNLAAKLIFEWFFSDLFSIGVFFHPSIFRQDGTSRGHTATPSDL